jgi:hypothetical protein
MKIKLFVFGLTLLLLLLLLFVIACTYVLTDNEAISIIQKDKDYSSFLETVKGFEPAVSSRMQMSQQNYTSLVSSNSTPSEMRTGLNFVDKDKLNDDTFLFILSDKTSENKGLMSVVDVKKKQSLIIISLVRIKAGVNSGG